MSKIKSDVNRFRQIVRGRVREELRKHLGHQELIARQGKRLVSIPIPHLELPRLVQIMLDRGWNDTRIQKVMGGNFLRVVEMLRG